MGEETSYKRTLKGYYRILYFTLVVHTVISNFTVDEFEHSYAFVCDELKPDSLIPRIHKICWTHMETLPEVLLVQDTTDLAYTHHPKTAGLGPSGDHRRTHWPIFPDPDLEQLLEGGGTHGRLLSP
jgi:hypothetical protein